jgi:hypothetical protein
MIKSFRLENLISKIKFAPFCLKVTTVQKILFTNRKIQEYMLLKLRMRPIWFLKHWSNSFKSKAYKLLILKHLNTIFSLYNSVIL